MRGALRYVPSVCNASFGASWTEHGQHETCVDRVRASLDARGVGAANAQCSTGLNGPSLQCIMTE